MSLKLIPKLNSGSVEERVTKKFFGEPKSIEEAVMYAVMVGPMSGLQTRVRDGLRNFLAQKFQAAITEASDDEAEKLLKLWFEITGER